MKRFIAVLIFSILMVTTVIAEPFDISSMTDEELLNFDNQIESEKVNRGYLTPLPQGKYLVGRDIAAGYYLIKGRPAKRYFSFLVRIYDTDAEETCLYDVNPIDTADIKIYLETGNVMYVAFNPDNCSVYIEKSQPLFSD